MACGRAHVRREILLLEEVIHGELHQDLVLETHAVHPIAGKRLVGPHGVDLAVIAP
jgi:hypothetical protein